MVLRKRPAAAAAPHRLELNLRDNVAGSNRDEHPFAKLVVHYNSIGKKN
jgi:hypothetical protein